MERVFEIYIRTTPERLWAAITDPEQRAKYNFGASMVGDLSVGGDFEMRAGRDILLGTGSNLEVDPPRRLVHTLHALFSDEAAAEPPSRVTWQIEPVGDSCRLVVTHDELRDGASEQVYGGWPMVLSGLKTWIETGTILTTPGSLAYA